MLNTAALLDYARAAHEARTGEPCSYYRLSKLLGITTSGVSNYRSGRSHPDDLIAARLAEVAGLDTLEVLAWMQVERARDEASRALWVEAAKRLASNSAGRPPGPSLPSDPPPDVGRITFRDLGALLRSGLSLLGGAVVYYVN